MLNLTLKKDGGQSTEECVQLRRKWASRVEENTVGMQLAEGETPPETVLSWWCRNFRASKDTLDEAASNWSWRRNLNEQRPQLLANQDKIHSIEHQLIEKRVL